MHQRPAALEQVAAAVRCLGAVVVDVRQGELADLPQRVGALGRPVRKLERNPCGTGARGLFNASDCLPSRHAPYAGAALPWWTNPALPAFAPSPGRSVDGSIRPRNVGVSAPEVAPANFSSIAGKRRIAQRRHLCPAQVRLLPTRSRRHQRTHVRDVLLVFREASFVAGLVLRAYQRKGPAPAFRLVRHVEPVLVDDAVQVFTQLLAQRIAGYADNGILAERTELDAVFARTGDIGGYRPVPRRFGRSRTAREQEIGSMAPQRDVGHRFRQSCLARNPSSTAGTVRSGVTACG